MNAKDALAELGDLVRCRCHPAYKDRKMHDPECHCDSAEAVSVLAAEDALLTSERDLRDTKAAALDAINRRLTAERDALRAALERIRDDGSGWQRDTARDALSSEAAEEWREIEQARQPRLDEGYTAVRISKPGFWLVKGPGPATAYSSTTHQKTAD